MNCGEIHGKRAGPDNAGKGCSLKQRMTLFRDEGTNEILRVSRGEKPRWSATESHAPDSRLGRRIQKICRTEDQLRMIRERDSAKRAQTAIQRVFSASVWQPVLDADNLRTGLNECNVVVALE